tara:strand:- start:3174 stop:3884 length:711 start_codon:yes stop_codon:yes gene_type:complete
MATNTNISFPQSEFLDPLTGRPSRAWMLWLMSPSVIAINSTTAVAVQSGGTGLSTIPTNGQLLIGNGVGYTLNTLTPGVGIGVTNGAGTIALANTGVLSWSGGFTGLTPATATTGAVTLSGVLNVASGGTNASTASIGSFNNITGFTATGATGTTSTNLVFSASPVFSGSVGIGATPTASAVLDAQSTTQGVRFPNMTTAQKNAIGAPAAGLVIFDTTLAKLCVYSGAAWQTITSV